MEHPAFISSKAYQIFVTELGRHLATADSVFALPEPEPTAELRKLAGVFHTIKGGAGFFGLDRIAELSGLLEKRLADVADTDLRELRELFLQLKQASEPVFKLRES
ncbi:MAG: Hpt domain-containing protein [Oligoflexia bacterium]|nr:Hpt domain-containing protein [Oligoflexia bacterium]